MFSTSDIVLSLWNNGVFEGSHAGISNLGHMSEGEEGRSVIQGTLLCTFPPLRGRERERERERDRETERERERGERKRDREMERQTEFKRSRKELRSSSQNEPATSDVCIKLWLK